MCLLYGESRILEKKYILKDFINETCRDIPKQTKKRFGMKRIVLKEMKDKNRVNHVYIVEKYPFGFDFQNTQMDK